MDNSEAKVLTLNLRILIIQLELILFENQALKNNIEFVDYVRLRKYLFYFSFKIKAVCFEPVNAVLERMQLYKKNN